MAAIQMAMLANGESPDECCRRHAIPQRCVETLCYPSRPPGDFDIYDIFERRGGGSPKQAATTEPSSDCSKYLHHVGECLAQGRDHSPCCVDEAKDRDEGACFGLCRGEGHARHANTWQHYQTCLAINLPSMFQCFQKGYREAPTPPQALVVAQIRASEAVVSWQAPAENAQLVDRYELAFYSVEEGEADRDSEVLLETADRQLTLRDLEPGSAYEVRVRALTADPNAKSLYASPALQFQTPGIAPLVEPFKRVVSVSAKSTSTLLACRFQVSSGGLFRTQWLRNSVPLDGQRRFNATAHYLYSASRPRRYVMPLDISELQPAQDAGEYTCVVRDDYGEKSAKVELKLLAETPPARPTPPLTPLECCQAKGVESRCLPMCGGLGEMENKRYVPRPIMPANCSGEISKVLSCAMPEVDDSACCLRGRVPQQCMYLCDSSLVGQNQMSSQCLEYLGVVEGCRTKGVQRRPSSIRNLRLTNPTSRTSSQTALVTWDESANAETYHIYWRNRRAGEPQWQWRSQSATNRRVLNADEIVVVAANAYGSSQAAKLRLSEEGATWVRSSGVVD